MSRRILPLLAATGFAAMVASIAHATTFDFPLAVPSRFVQAGLVIAAAAPDSAAPAPLPEGVTDVTNERSFLRKHPVLGGTLVFLGYQALLAIPSAAAYSGEDGKMLAGVDAVFAASMLITPDGGRGETLGGAIGVLALAGGMLAAANNGASQDQLFFLNWAGLNVAILGGHWIGSKFD
jgi:hypothetical protein